MNASDLFDAKTGQVTGQVGGDATPQPGSRPQSATATPPVTRQVAGQVTGEVTEQGTGHSWMRRLTRLNGASFRAVRAGQRRENLTRLLLLAIQQSLHERRNVFSP